MTTEHLFLALLFISFYVCVVTRSAKVATWSFVLVLVGLLGWMGS